MDSNMDYFCRGSADWLDSGPQPVTCISESSQRDSATDLTLPMSGRLRWIPEHPRQMKTPREQEAHSGSDWPKRGGRGEVGEETRGERMTSTMKSGGEGRTEEKWRDMAALRLRTPKAGSWTHGRLQRIHRFTTLQSCCYLKHLTELKLRYTSYCSYSHNCIITLHNQLLSKAFR